ncbi:hypothetical protein, partial [Vibrio vulnificus]|uniref:hypothetical protein n=1 Tax=Vibrio vulnificus TaxID=672 RepID=UPI001A8C8B10
FIMNYYSNASEVKTSIPLIKSQHIISKQLNAQLRGEQRLHPNLKHCAINTKFAVEAKMPSVVNPS